MVNELLSIRLFYTDVGTQGKRIMLGGRWLFRAQKY